LGKETANPSIIPAYAEFKEIPAALYAVASFEQGYDTVKAWTDFFFEAIPQAGYAPNYEHGFFFFFFPDGAHGNYELWTPVVVKTNV
jgi:DNA gyrase inhibitor GyrI